MNLCGITIGRCRFMAHTAGRGLKQSFPLLPWLRAWPCQKAAGESDLNCGDGLHLDQEFFLHQAVHHQQGIRRRGAIGEKFWDLAQAVGHEIRDVLAVHEVGGELYDITPTGTFGGEGFFDIAEDLGALGIEIANSDGVAVLVGGQRSGDEEKLRSLDPRYL